MSREERRGKDRRELEGRVRLHVGEGQPLAVGQLRPRAAQDQSLRRRAHHRQQPDARLLQASAAAAAAAAAARRERRVD